MYGWGASNVDAEMDWRIRDVHEIFIHEVHWAGHEDRTFLNASFDRPASVCPFTDDPRLPRSRLEPWDNAYCRCLHSNQACTSQHRQIFRPLTATIYESTSGSCRWLAEYLPLWNDSHSDVPGMGGKPLSYDKMTISPPSAPTSLSHCVWNGLLSSLAYAGLEELGITLLIVLPYLLCYGGQPARSTGNICGSPGNVPSSLSGINSPWL